MTQGWFDEHELVGGEELGQQLGHRLPLAERLRCGGVRVTIEEEQPGRLRADGEATPAVGKRPVAGQALVVERGEHRIERMLNGSEVPAGRPGPDGGALDQRDPRAAIGEDGGCSAADDPSADDDDLGSHSPSIGDEDLSSPATVVRRPGVDPSGRPERSMWHR